VKDLGDGELEAGALGEVGGLGGGEDGLAATAGQRILDGATCGVVLVAESLIAEAGRLAAVPAGEDVTALQAGLFVVEVYLVGVGPWCCLPFGDGLR